MYRICLPDNVVYAEHLFSLWGSGTTVCARQRVPTRAGPVKSWTLSLQWASWAEMLPAYCYGKSVLCVAPRGRESIRSLSRTPLDSRSRSAGAARRKHRGLRGLDNCLFPIVLEAENARSRCLRLGSWWAFFLARRRSPSYVLT